MIVIGNAPLGRGCALACAPCSSAGPAAASAAPVRRTLRRSISLSSAVGWLTISPSMAHRSHALRSLKIEAWLWPPVKETGPRRCRRAILLAPTDGTASGHEGCKKPKGIPINESALRDVEAAAIGQPVLMFAAATGAASTRPLRAWRREKVDALFVTGGGFFVALERGQAYEPEVP